MSSMFAVLDAQKFIVVLLLTIVPSILLLSLILYSDRKSREPLMMILICILSGAFTICLSLIVDKIVIACHFIIGDLLTNSYSYSIYKIMILAGVEEYAKLLVLHLFLYKNRAYDDIYDGFVYSSIIALSFAVIETFMYVFNESTYADMTSLAILRNFTSIPLHIACGIAMGHFVSLEKFSKVKKWKFINLVLAMAVPIFIHTVYNSFFSIASLSNGTVLSVVIILIFVLSVYFVGVMFIYKTHKLNKIFITNGDYPKRYRYLLNKFEFETNKINEKREGVIYNDTGSVL